jgi:Lon protease-like protein
MLRYDTLNRKQKILPFFPLGVFLLPGEDLPLRIFEPRYLQLIQDATEEQFTFAIPFSKDNEIMEYGCEVKLQQVVAESKQGQKVITVESVSLLRINNYTSTMAGKLYPGGNVEILSPTPPVKSIQLIDLVMKYMREFDKDFLKVPEGEPLCYYDVLRSLNLSSEDKYKFVMQHCDECRENYLVKHIEYLMLIRQQEKKLNNDFQQN